MTSTNRITKLETKRLELDEQIRLLRAKEGARERKAENRRKYLLGALLLSEMNLDETTRRSVMERLDKFLDRNCDRRYFGLSSRPRTDDRSGDVSADPTPQKLNVKKPTEAEAIA